MYIKQLNPTKRIILAGDHTAPAPQEKQTNLSPGRVAQSISGVFAAIRTSAVSPKLRGKFPGWPAGKVRLRRIRYPTAKNTTPIPPKEQPKSA